MNHGDMLRPWQDLKIRMDPPDATPADIVTLLRTMIALPPHHCLVLDCPQPRSDRQWLLPPEYYWSHEPKEKHFVMECPEPTSNRVFVVILLHRAKGVIHVPFPGLWEGSPDDPITLEDLATRPNATTKPSLPLPEHHWKDAAMSISRTALATVTTSVLRGDPVPLYLDKFLWGCMSIGVQLEQRALDYAMLERYWDAESIRAWERFAGTQRTRTPTKWRTDSEM